jgi:hypothetical protein
MGYRSDVTIILTEQLLIDKYTKVINSKEYKDENEIIYPDQIKYSPTTKLYQLDFYQLKWYDGYSFVDIMNENENQYLKFRQGEESDDIEFSNHQLIINDSIISIDITTTWNVDEPNLYITAKELVTTELFQLNSLRLHCDTKTFIKLKDLYLTTDNIDLLNLKNSTYKYGQNFVLYYLNYETSFDISIMTKFFRQQEKDETESSFNFAYVDDGDKLNYIQHENLESSENLCSIILNNDFNVSIIPTNNSTKVLLFNWEEVDYKSTIDNLIKGVKE